MLVVGCVVYVDGCGTKRNSAWWGVNIELHNIHKRKPLFLKQMDDEIPLVPEESALSSRERAAREGVMLIIHTMYHMIYDMT